MALTPEETRVLACLIEKEATVPDSYPLTLNSLRLACNQTTNRHPVVSFEDRTVDQALVSLKSIGLVRFVHPSHGGRTIRYRHVAHERWHLERNEIIVLAMLMLRGPQTVNEIRTRVERVLEPDGPSVDDALDALAARSPEPFAVRLERRPGEREPRWAHLLAGPIDESSFEPPPPRASAPFPAPSASRSTDDRYAALEAAVARLQRRLDRLEELLGVEPLDDADQADGADGADEGNRPAGADHVTDSAG
jgi:uncharacterized protein YceH (UPF0502 family)